MKDVTPVAKPVEEKARQYLFQLTNEEKTIIAQMGMDGKMEYPTGIKPDDAAAIFFNSVGANARELLVMNRNLLTLLRGMVNIVELINIAPDNEVLYEAKKLLSQVKET